MYAPKVIEKNLETFADNAGWMPVRHTLAEVDELKQEIDSLVRVESNSQNSYISLAKRIGQRRQEQIRRKVENEQVLCALDSGYFESRYAYVTDESGNVVKFSNRKSQEVIDAIFAEEEEEGRATELLILSGRQAGVSTKTILKLFHRVLFVPHTGFLLAAQKDESYKRVLDIVYNHAPWWLVPCRLPKHFFENGSVSLVQPNNRIPQGLTPQAVFVGDVETILNPAKTIEEGLLRALHPSRPQFTVLRGSVDSDSDWLWNTWQRSKEYWAKGQSRLRPVFIPWAVCSDIYPHENWLEKYPVPEAWKPMAETVEHAGRCEEFVRGSPYLARIAGEQWSMPVSQKWFWEYGYKRAEATKTLPRYLTHMTPDDDRFDAKLEDIDLDNVFPSSVAMQKRVRQLLTAPLDGNQP